MRCESAQRELSAAMHESAPAPPDVRRHADGCPRCSGYVRDLHRLHQLARLEPAPPVPDLAPEIMRLVREERLREPTPVSAGRHRPERSTGSFRRLVAAGLAAGLVVGFVLGAGGLFPNREAGQSALASEIPRRLVQAAVNLRGYRATFDVTERNWSPQVPLRTFAASVAYRAPEDFRVMVRDTTRYPSPQWPRNDLELVTNGRFWEERGSNPCPPSELPACHPDVLHRTVMHRIPFDDQTQMPTDVIVPMTVLAAANRVHVIGPDTVNGRPAEAVALRYQDATPLLSYLQFLGSWRPFYPQDRVVLWLDRSTWFPLKYQVFAAPGEGRALWASQMGVDGDRPGLAIFSAQVRSLTTRTPPESAFEIPRSQGVVDEGFRDLLPGTVPGPLRLPASSRLRLVRFGHFVRTEARPYGERLAAYARGLAWATVARVTDWSARRLFGAGEFAQRLELPGAAGGVGYYEPATSFVPRHVAIHTSRGEFLVTSNLPQDDLLRLAGSLGVRGSPAPRSWLVRRWAGGVIRDGVSLEQAGRDLRFPVLIPRTLPSGYAAAPAQLVDTPRVRAVTLVYRRPAAELDGIGLRLYQSVGSTLPPPQSVSEVAVGVRGQRGRWSADEHLLEWVEDGVYRSLSSPAFDLPALLQIARSLEPLPRG